MNKINLLLASTLLVSGYTVAQEKTDTDLNSYMRSSLYTIILDDHGLMDNEKSEIIKETFFATPLPEKFNDHNLENELRTFNPSNYKVSQEEVDKLQPKAGKKKKKGGGFGKFAKSVAGSATAGVVDTTDTDKLPAIFNKYFETNNIGNKIVSKWYNESPEYDAATSSHFNMELIKERGLYNATEFDKSVADKSTRGVSMLADAGENLINNTFVVGIRFNYVSKEEIAKQVAATTSAITGLIGGQAAALANSAVQAGTAVVGKGYVIKATAFLYQLDWNNETSNKFYSDYYAAEDLTEFGNSEDFNLKYIGSESEWADIQSTSFSKQSETDLIKRAAVRSVDEVIAKLQKKFEAFRTKTPLLTTEPSITAQIGLKEGLKAGDKYEVLEKMQDPETNITTYKRVCVLKVEKNKIWDNRFAADEERTEGSESSEEVTSDDVKATSFSGSSKNIYPGMLIRQIN